MEILSDELDDEDFASFTETACKTSGLSRQPTQPSSSKKAQSWIASSFDGFDLPDSASNEKQKPALKKVQSRGTKRPWETVKGVPHERLSQDTAPKPSTSSSEALWADKYTPKSPSDLAVHKKKVQEVQGWLTDCLAGKLKKTPFLLLTGPSGAGKTATISALSQEMRLEVQEWINPVQDEPQNWNIDSHSEHSQFGHTSRYTSQTQLFRDFLLRSNKYAALSIFSDGATLRKVILVEDFPNVFFRDPAVFHETLRAYRVKGHCPLIFIVSDSQGSESTEKLLFPQHVQAELGIANISFNPVAVTSLVKTLTKMASTESSANRQKFTLPCKDTIDALANASAGDIRGAINALQFACLKVPLQSNPVQLKPKSAKGMRTSTKLTSRQKGGEKRSAAEDRMAAMGARDTSLFLFRALGKILYCKREEKDVGDQTRLPDHLAHHHRKPLKEVPEDVVEKSHMSSALFTAFLHQNYPDFFSDVDDVIMATEYLSDADYLTIDWTSRSALGEYSVSVATRGLMFSNSSRAKSSEGKGSGPGWKPLHKPEVFSVSRRARDQGLAGRQLFTALRQTPEELHTQVLPYLSLINTQLSSPAQISYLQEMARFPVHRYSGSRRAERLDEKEVSEVDLADDTEAQDTKMSCSQGEMTNVAVEDEEMIIEDFED